MAIGSITGGISGGGRDLGGNAQGSISINTRPAQAAVAEMRKVGQDIAKSLEPASKAIASVEKQLGGLGKAGSLGSRISGGLGGGISKEVGIASAAVDDFIAKARTPAFQRFGNSVRGAFGQAQTAAQRFGNVLQGALARVGGGLRSMGDGIQAVRTELVAIGLGAATLTKIGLDGAKSIRNYRVSFTQLLGDEKQAVDLMTELTTQANRFGLEVDETWQLARALLPSLEGNTEELGKFVTRAALLASTNPLKSTVDASRAIQEYLSGQTISLQRLFNVDPNIIAEAKAEFEGVGEQLDYILSRLGATEAGALQMADAFTSVKNELKLALAQGFTPLFQALQPAARQFSEFVGRLREANPALLTFGAGLIGIVAVGAPLLLFLGQVIISLEKIKALSIAASLGKAGVLAGAAIGGAAAGNLIGRGIGAAVGNEDIANTTMRDIPNLLKQLVVVMATALTGMVLLIEKLMLGAVQLLVNGVAAMVNSMASFANVIGNILPDAMGGNKLREIGANLSVFATNLKETAELGRRTLEANTADVAREFLTRIQEFIFPTADAAVPTTGAGDTTGTGGAGGFSDEQTSAITSWWEQIKELEAAQAQARLDATKQYEEQRTELIENYGEQQAREEMDFLRQRRRQNEQFNQEVAKIAQERAKQEAAWLDDLNEQIGNLRSDSAGRVADMQEEGNERLLEIEETYQRDRERAAEEHQNNLLNAASRLDARAIADEQRRFGLQETQASREFTNRINDERAGLQKRIEQERENLEERIKQEQAAHEERILAAREADEQRVNDMRESLAEQQRLEDEDRAIRLRRTEDDHQKQLRALETANGKRLTEMDVQAGKELAALNKKFQAELAQLGLASTAQLTYQRKAQNDALKEFATYWDDWNKIIKDQSDIDPTKDQTKTGSKVKGFQSGGVVDYTGLASVHGTSARPEYMLDSNTTAALRGMMGNFNQAQLLGAVAGGGRSSSITLADGAIRVYGLPGQSPEDIGMAVRNELAGLFEEIAR